MPKRRAAAAGDDSSDIDSEPDALDWETDGEPCGEDDAGMDSDEESSDDDDGHVEGKPKQWRNWGKEHHECPRLPFERVPGPQIPLREMKQRCGRKPDEDLEPADVFKQCFAGMDPDGDEYIPENSFKYVNAKRAADRPEEYKRKHWPPKWTRHFTDKDDITAADIWLFIGMTLFMGLVKLPALRDYFTKSRLLR